MMYSNPVQNLLVIFVTVVAMCSCQPKPPPRQQLPVMFPVNGTDIALFGLGPEAAGGRLDCARPQKWEYCFAEAPAFSAPMSFEIEYGFEGTPAAGEQRLVLELGEHSWELPVGTGADYYHYAVPFTSSPENTFPATFSIALIEAAVAGKQAAGQQVTVHIDSVAFTGRWFGLYRLRDIAGVHLFATPFASGQPGNWTLDPPAAFSGPAGFYPALSSDLYPPDTNQRDGVAVESGKYRFEVSPLMNRFNIPAGLLTPGSGPLFVTGDRVVSPRIVYAQPPRFPQPITADPGMVLAWPAEHWRDRRYELFRWEQFPSLLIFDMADYAVQDRMLKRLAFFVEKAGFRGRLAPDAEIADLHGWNAHDYRAEDLARFFQTARAENFPLLNEERELEQILLQAGIIVEADNEIRGGEGGIISISRESAEYLRFRFMAHEGFHGLFFIDNDFREFSRRRWQQFPAEAKRFIISFFNYQRYDTADPYLLVNEFMAHILQMPVSQAAGYFGVTLPARLESTWRRQDLPAKDEASGSWPVLANAFTREAEAFSAYVSERWGLAAGRVHLVTVRQR